MKIAYHLMLDQLVTGCKKGDRAAQEKLYKFFYGKMMGVCMRYANCRDEAAAILNTGFYKVFKKIDTYQPEQGQLEAWICRIMINTAIDHYRKEMRKGRTVDITAAQYAESPALAMDQLQAEDLLALIQELTPGYRTVFNLYAIEGYSHKEIAERLGISEGTSKSNLAKARKKLQAALEKQQSEKSTSYGR